MGKSFERVWKLALPYLKQGKAKDYLIHTRGVVKAMELLLEHEKGDEKTLIPAAILHDIGWSKVPLKLQKSNNESERIEALKLHIKLAPPIVEEVLNEAGYKKDRIEKIVAVVVAHQFQKPKDLDKQLLIDADSMADAFKEQFYSDAKAYGKTPRELYEFRKNNKFFTKTAKELFAKELEKRRKEIEKKGC